MTRIAMHTKETLSYVCCSSAAEANSRLGTPFVRVVTQPT